MRLTIAGGTFLVVLASAVLLPGVAGAQPAPDAPKHTMAAFRERLADWRQAQEKRFQDAARNSKEPAAKAAACRFLGPSGATEAVDVLIKLLKSDQPVVVEAAASALTWLRATDSIKPMFRARIALSGKGEESRAMRIDEYLALLLSPDTVHLATNSLDNRRADVRAAGARLLGLLGYTEAVAELKALLYDASPAVRAGARQALSAMRVPAASAALSEQLVDVVAYLGGESAAPQVNVTYTVNYDENQNALPVQYLEVAGPKRVNPRLDSIARDSGLAELHSPLPIALVAGIGEAGVAAGAPGLAIALDKGLWVEEALDSAAKIGANGLCESVLGHLKAKSPNTFRLALEAALVCCQKEHFETIRNAMSMHRELLAPQTVLAAARGMRDRELFRSLVPPPLMSGVDLSEYYEAAVEILGGEAAGIILELMRKMGEERIRAGMKREYLRTAAQWNRRPLPDPEAGSAFTMWFRLKRPLELLCRTGSAEAMSEGLDIAHGLLGKYGAHVYLASSLEAKSFLPVCVTELVAAQVPELVGELLGGKSELARILGAVMAGEGGLGQFRPKVARLLEDTGKEVRLAAARALGRMPFQTETAGILRQMFLSLAEEDMVRGAAARAYAHLKGQEGTDEVAAAVREGKLPRRLVSGLIPPEEAETVRLMLEVLDELVRRDARLESDGPHLKGLGLSLALSALKRQKDPRAAELLLGLLDHADMDLHIEAARQLGELGQTEAIPALLRSLNHPFHIAALAAAEALILMESCEAVAPLRWAFRLQRNGLMRRDLAAGLTALVDECGTELD